MKLPKSIKVGNVKFSILLDWNGFVLQGDEGVCYHQPPVIYLNPYAENLGVILLEEIAHAVGFVFEVNINMGLKNHSTAFNLFYDTLKRNDLIKKIKM